MKIILNSFKITLLQLYLIYPAHLTEKQIRRDNQPQYPLVRELQYQMSTKSSGSAQTVKNILQNYQLIAKNFTPMASMNLSLRNNNQKRALLIPEFMTVLQENYF